MYDNPTSDCMARLSDAELTQHVTTAATLPGSTRTGKLVSDKFADRSPTAWTHRFKTPAVTEYRLYDQIWTAPTATRRCRLVDHAPDSDHR